MALRSKEEFLQSIMDIGACENEADRRELLATLHEEAGELYDTNQTLTETNQTLTTENEGLQQANMKLFLRVGNPATEQSQNQNRTGIDNPPEKRKFEDLFDEKGGIK